MWASHSSSLNYTKAMWVSNQSPVNYTILMWVFHQASPLNQSDVALSLISTEPYQSDVGFCIYFQWTMSKWCTESLVHLHTKAVWVANPYLLNHIKVVHVSWASSAHGGWAHASLSATFSDFQQSHVGLHHTRVMWVSITPKSYGSLDVLLLKNAIMWVSIIPIKCIAITEARAIISGCTEKLNEAICGFFLQISVLQCGVSHPCSHAQIVWVSWPLYWKMQKSHVGLSYNSSVWVSQTVLLNNEKVMHISIILFM